MIARIKCLPKTRKIEDTYEMYQSSRKINITKYTRISIKEIQCNSKRMKLEEEDENCRLRYGLNIHCLAEIFQYLDSGDLYIVGEMNEFYMQIINDLVIPKHTVNFSKLFERRIKIRKMFETYGPKIQKLYFFDFENKYATDMLMKSITQYCGNDQIKSAVMSCCYLDKTTVVLPIQFEKVQKLNFEGNSCMDQPLRLSAQLSESLRYLRLADINLDPNFDWAKLKNLTELYLHEVNGINVNNFIEFLRLRPNIKIFHHSGDSFKGSMQHICEAMAKYCGNHIQNYYGEMAYIPNVRQPPAQNISYGFLSKFKNLMEVRLVTHQLCGGDLIDTMKQLAENDTIETLRIKYSEYDMDGWSDGNCTFQAQPNLNGFDMNNFSHLKTIKISGHLMPLDEPFGDFHHHKVCNPFKLLTVYGSQILATVEKLTISAMPQNCSFIKFARKIRHLDLYVEKITFAQTAKLLSILRRIFQDRNNRLTSGQFVSTKINNKHVYEISDDEFNGRSDSIKLSVCQYFDEYNVPDDIILL